MLFCPRLDPVEDMNMGDDPKLQQVVRTIEQLEEKLHKNPGKRPVLNRRRAAFSVHFCPPHFHQSRIGCLGNCAST